MQVRYHREHPSYSYFGWDTLGVLWLKPTRSGRYRAAGCHVAVLRTQKYTKYLVNFAEHLRVISGTTKYIISNDDVPVFSLERFSELHEY